MIVIFQLEVPIGMANLHELARYSRHKADYNILPSYSKT